MQSNYIPRRFRVDQLSQAEFLLYQTMIETENLGADERLTKVISLLDEAKNLLADYVDEQPQYNFMKVQPNPHLF